MMGGWDLSDLMLESPEALLPLDLRYLSVRVSLRPVVSFSRRVMESQFFCPTHTLRVSPLVQRLWYN